MAEYIEREALLSHQYNKSWSREPQFAEMVVDVENIYDAPAADVVEVVRVVIPIHPRFPFTFESRNRYFRHTIV